jgi:glycosyltransferase involved in cell wall biosynthesis
VGHSTRQAADCDRLLIILWQRLSIPIPVEMIPGRADVFHALDIALPPSVEVRRVVTIHDVAFLTHAQSAMPSLARYRSAIVPRSLPRADAIMVPSENTAADIVARYGVTRERIDVIAPGVTGSFTPVDDRQALATIDARHRLKHPLVLSVGTSEARKRSDHLIAAFAQACQQAGGPRMLAICGRRGWLNESIFQADEEYHVSDAVRFLDYVPDDEL